MPRLNKMPWASTCSLRKSFNSLDYAKNMRGYGGTKHPCIKK
jgi:hypothetical protein